MKFFETLDGKIVNLEHVVSFYIKCGDTRSTEDYFFSYLYIADEEIGFINVDNDLKIDEIHYLIKFSIDYILASEVIGFITQEEIEDYAYEQLKKQKKKSNDDQS